MTQQTTWIPGAAPIPPRRRGRLVAILVAAAVLLLALITALALVVVWAGDETIADPVDPVPMATAVTGDLDGDGYGDAVAVLVDPTALTVTAEIWSSAGSAFGSPTARELPLGNLDQPLIGDWDGDGVRTVIGWDSGEGLSIRAWDESFADIELTDVGGDTDVELVSGDFDGDGRTDLATYTYDEEEEITVHVLLSNGDGFDAPAAWATVGGLDNPVSVLAPADFDSDGVDDLLAFVNTPFAGTPGELDASHWDAALLTSSGASFEVGDVMPAPDLDLTTGEVLVGDFTGSGTPQFLAQEVVDDTISVRLLTWDGSALQEDVGFQAATEFADGSSLQSVGVSDVDGDGLDDVVGIANDVSGYTGVVVLRSTGTGFAEPETWGEVPDCDCVSIMARGR